VDIAPFVHAIQASPPAEWMRTSVKAMPIVESVHVLAAATVFGSVFVVDLRLLGLIDTARPVTRIAREMLRLTWVAFGVAVIAGALMFSANAHTYVINTAFRLKMAALLLAGVNMVVFHALTYRTVDSWDRSNPVPLPARIAGLTSILLWVCVICCARWIGFTKGYDFSIPQNTHIDFQF